MVVPLAILDIISNTIITTEAIIVIIVRRDAYLVPVTLIAGLVKAQVTGEKRVRIHVITVQAAANQMDALYLGVILDIIEITTVAREDMYVINATISVHRVLITICASHAAKIIGVPDVNFRVPAHAKHVHQKRTVRAVTQDTGVRTVSTVVLLV